MLFNIKLLHFCFIQCREFCVVQGKLSTQ